MKRKFLTNLILLIFLNLLVKPLWVLGIDRTVQNVVGDHNYGFYFSLFNFSMLMNFLLDVGITNYNNRNIARHGFLLQKHFSNIVGLKLILAVVYAVVCLVTAAIVGYDKLQFNLLFFLIFNQFLISFTLYLRSNISALHQFKTDSLLSVLDRAIMIIICSVLLYTNLTNGKFLIEWFVYAQTAAYLITTVVALGIVLTKTGQIKININRSFIVVFLRKSYPYALLILLMSLYNRSDSVLLERLLSDNSGKEQAGIYAQAFRLLDAVSMFGALFAGLLLPIFSRMLKQNDDIGPMVKLAYTLLIMPSIIIAISCMFYNQEIMALLYKSNTEHSSGLLGILMLGFIGIATTYIFGTLLTANGSIRQLNVMATFGVLVNILLNLLLIPKFMAFGAAYSSMITQLGTGLAQLILAIVVFKLKPGWQFPLRILGFAAGVVVIGFASLHFPNKAVGYFFMIGISGILGFLLRLLSFKDLFQLIIFKNNE